MFRKILVPLDRSRLAEQAIGQAVAIARACRATIDIMLVHEPFQFDGYEGGASSAKDFTDELQYVESIAAELSADASVRVTTSVVHGSPAEAISQRATEVDADLIVMTSHGRTGLSRVWLGSVADAVMRRSPIPVLMLRPFATAPDRLLAQRLFRHLLVPLDGSLLSANVLPTAAALARASCAKLTLLRVVPPVPLIPPYAAATMPLTFPPTIPDEAATRLLVEEAGYHLADAARRLAEDEGLATIAEVRVGTGAARAIVDFAHAHDVDVIAMSTHGRGASRWLIGSVADKVLRASGLPVLMRRSIESHDQPVLMTEEVEEQLPALTG